MLRILRMKSFAVTFGWRLPRTVTFTDSGTFTRTSFVIHELKTSVVPIPNAMQPIAPECGVCESEPTTTCPGSALLSEIALLQLQLCGEIEQAHLAPFFGDHFIEKCQVIAKEDDRRWVGDRRVLADVHIEKDRRHRRDVFVRE